MNQTNLTSQANSTSGDTQAKTSIWGLILSTLGVILSIFSYLILIIRMITPDVWTYYDIFHSYYPYISQGNYILLQKAFDFLWLFILLAVLILIIARIVSKKGVAVVIFLILDSILLLGYGASYILAKLMGF